MSSEQPSAPAKVSLTEFLDANQRTVAVIGVFLALAIYWNNQPLKPISSFLSFLCFAVTMPMFFEVYRNYFNTSNRSWNLTVFAGIFAPILFNSMWFFLVNYRDDWKSQMYSVVFWMTLLPIAILYSRMKVMRALATKILDRQTQFVTWILIRQKVPYTDDYTPDMRERNVTVFSRFLTVAFATGLFIFSMNVAKYASPQINRLMASYYAKYHEEDLPKESPVTPQQTTIVLFPIQVQQTNTNATPAPSNSNR